MAKKTRKPPMAEPSAVAAQNVILERMEEQQRVVIEAVTMTRESLERRIDEGDRKLASKIEVLEIAVKKNSADIRKNSADIQKNSADIQKNSLELQRINEELRAVSDKLDTKADAGRVGSLESRVEALESDPG